jgi:molybdenum cofactor biosynthesis enzyme MoaA
MGTGNNNLPTYLSRDVFLCVEMTDACDLKCAMCDQSLRDLPHGAKRGTMDPALWRRIIDSLAADGVALSGMAPHWLGESMIHPQFPALLDYAFEQNARNRVFGFFSMNTNGLTLAGENAEAILRCAARTDQNQGTFRQIFVSIDAATAPTFARIKGKDALGEVERNVGRFIAEQAARLPAGHRQDDRDGGEPGRGAGVPRPVGGRL